MLHDVPGFVMQNAHALRRGPAFHVDDHLALEPHQTGMGQIKRNGDARRYVGAEPFVRDPGMRPDAQPAPAELVVEIGQARLEPRAFDRDLEVLEAKLQELVVGQRGPGKLARHGVPELGKSAGGGWGRGPKSSIRSGGLAEVLANRGKGNAKSPYSAASFTAPTRSTRAAQNLNSGIFPNGSSAGLVNRLAAAST